MNLSRRRFWSYAAPAIVLAPNIMRVSAAALESLPERICEMRQINGRWVMTRCIGYEAHFENGGFRLTPT